MSTKAFPLQWPADWPRTHSPQTSKFDTSLTVASEGLLAEIRLKGGRNVVLSSNMTLKADGIPHARQGRIEDTGVAVYWDEDGRACSMACDRWTDLADNIQALRKTIEAFRGIERWGSTEMSNRAYAGFLQLPAPGQSKVRSWQEVLEINHALSGAVDEDYLKLRYKKLRSKRHPDHPELGGSDAAMFELTEAYEQALQSIKNRY